MEEATEAEGAAAMTLVVMTAAGGVLLVWGKFTLYCCLQSTTVTSNVMLDLRSKPPSKYTDFDQTARCHRFLRSVCVSVASACGPVLENLQTRCCFSWVLLQKHHREPICRRAVGPQRLFSFLQQMKRWWWWCSHSSCGGRRHFRGGIFVASAQHSGPFCVKHGRR